MWPEENHVRRLRGKVWEGLEVWLECGSKVKKVGPGYGSVHPAGSSFSPAT